MKKSVSKRNSNRMITMAFLFLNFSMPPFILSYPKLRLNEENHVYFLQNTFSKKHDNVWQLCRNNYKKLETSSPTKRANATSSPIKRNNLKTSWWGEFLTSYFLPMTHPGERFPIRNTFVASSEPKWIWNSERVKWQYKYTSRDIFTKDTRPKCDFQTPFPIFCPSLTIEFHWFSLQ